MPRSMTQFREILKDFADKLSKIKGKESHLAQIENAILKDDNDLITFLKSNELWGGSGSIADDPLSNDSRIRREFENILVKLGTLQIKNGIVNIRTKMWVKAFKKWSLLNL